MRIAWRRGGQRTVTKFNLLCVWLRSECLSRVFVVGTQRWLNLQGKKKKSNLGSSSKVAYHHFCGLQQFPGVSLWWKVVIYSCVSSLSLSLPPQRELHTSDFSCMFHFWAPAFTHSAFCSWTVFWSTEATAGEIDTCALNITVYDCWMSGKRESGGKFVLIHSDWHQNLSFTTDVSTETLCTFEPLASLMAMGNVFTKHLCFGQLFCRKKKNTLKNKPRNGSVVVRSSLKFFLCGFSREIEEQGAQIQDWNMRSHWKLFTFCSLFYDVCVNTLNLGNKSN